MTEPSLFCESADLSKTWDNPVKKDYVFIDLFAGCGGLSYGMEMAGLKCLAAVEIKERASYTYSQNLHHQILTDDITLAETKEKLESIVDAQAAGRGVDIVAGGPPCQGFSMAGKRVIDDPRNKLYKEFIEVVRKFQPSVVIMENVPGLLTMGHGTVIKQIMEDFNHIGYDVSVKVLNAADYYVPQTRQRMILIGNRIGVTNLHPQPLLLPREYVTVKEAIGDLEFAPENVTISHILPHHNDEKVAAFNLLTPGEHYCKKYNGTLRRLYWDKPSFTVTYSNGSCDIHPSLPRVFTLRELARLQSFPDDFMFYGSQKEQGVMIGNAVPPLLGKAIGLSVIQMLDSVN